MPLCLPRSIRNASFLLDMLSDFVKKSSGKIVSKANLKVVAERILKLLEVIE
jgi:DNA replication initiation complex subunit (GINS family)